MIEVKRRTEPVEIDGVGEVTVVELSARAAREISAATEKGDMFAAAAWAVRYGIEEFADTELDEILDMPFKLVSTLASHVNRVSGIDDPEEEVAGNSDGAPAIGSDSD